MRLKHSIRKAERYLHNARQILSEKAEINGDYNHDSKYMKIASHKTWCSVLGAKDINISLPFLDAYESLHKTLGCDDNSNYKIERYTLKADRI